MPKSLNIITQSPRFWFYISYPPDNVDSLNFVLQDVETQNFIQPPGKISLSGTPGFIGIPLPSGHSVLERGKTYNWFFSVYCDPQNQEDRISYTGQVKVSIAINSLTDRLPLATIHEQARLYQEHGYWYDAFNILASLGQNNQFDLQLKSDWENLLTQLNLSELINQPITPCCVLENP